MTSTNPSSQDPNDFDLLRIEFEDAQADDNVSEMVRIAATFREIASAQEDEKKLCEGKLLSSVVAMKVEDMDELSMSLDKIVFEFEEPLSESPDLYLRLLALKLASEIHHELPYHAEQTFSGITELFKAGANAKDSSAAILTESLFLYAELQCTEPSKSSSMKHSRREEAMAAIDLASDFAELAENIELIPDYASMLKFGVDLAESLGDFRKSRNYLEALVEYLKEYPSEDPFELADAQMRWLEQELLLQNTDGLEKKLQTFITRSEHSDLNPVELLALQARAEFVWAETEFERGETKSALQRCLGIHESVKDLKSSDFLFLKDNVLGRLCSVYREQRDFEKLDHFTNLRKELVDSFPVLVASAEQVQADLRNVELLSGDPARKIEALERDFDLIRNQLPSLTENSVSVIEELGELKLNTSDDATMAKSFSTSILNLVKNDTSELGSRLRHAMHSLAARSNLALISELEGSLSEHFGSESLRKAATEHAEKALAILSNERPSHGPLHYAADLLTLGDAYALRSADEAHKSYHEGVSALDGIPDQDCGALRASLLGRTAPMFLSEGSTDKALDILSDAVQSLQADEVSAPEEMAKVHNEIASKQIEIAVGMEPHWGRQRSMKILDRVIPELESTKRPLEGLPPLAAITEHMDCLELLIKASTARGLPSGLYEIERDTIAHYLNL